jgi:hypothetical protein
MRAAQNTLAGGWRYAARGLETPNALRPVSVSVKTEIF